MYTASIMKIRARFNAMTIFTLKLVVSALWIESFLSSS